MIRPATATVGPSPLKILAKLAIVSGATTGGVTILVVFLELLAAVGLLGVLAVPPELWSYRWIIIACTAALTACYCGIAVLGAIIWRRPRVEIGPDGFVDYGILGHRSRRWSDIEGSFTVIRFGWGRVVAYRLTDTFKESARINPIASLAGNDEAILICGELAIAARELADVLNRWKQGVPSATASTRASG
jgi:hypothetical protein